MFSTSSSLLELVPASPDGASLTSGKLRRGVPASGDYVSSRLTSSDRTHAVPPTPPCRDVAVAGSREIADVQSKHPRKERQMHGEEAIIWFVITALGLVALLTIGIYEGTHAYSKKTRASRHHLRWH
jgi:hypothetical protein